ncbi:hypothetical protein [Methylobacterium oryzae]|uniref:hypothetical protein n=1 Tax=Methylobacterium oryzae TaxID=334852 RepID=UPI002F35197C
MDDKLLVAYTELAKYGVIVAGIFVFGATIATCVAFSNAGPDKARVFASLIEKMGVLQLVTVLNIILAVGILTFMGKINSEGAISIYSGIAGYVLGGLRPIIRSSSVDRDNKGAG